MEQHWGQQLAPQLVQNWVRCLGSHWVLDCLLELHWAIHWAVDWQWDSHWGQHWGLHWGNHWVPRTAL